MSNDLTRRRRAEGLDALAQRLPGQRTPPDPSLEQPNAADLTYGWHRASSSDGDRENDEVEDQLLGGRRAWHERADHGIYHDANDIDDDDDDDDDGDDMQRDARHEPAQGNATAGPSSTSNAADAWSTWWKSGTEAPPQQQQQQNNGEQHSDTDSFVCRICFDGPGSLDEGGESLGKLIAPCRCRGTMKFVHQGCLTRWRATSRRQTSVMQCDQCGAPYRFRKSRFVGLATNKLLLMVFSVYMFISIVWLVGFAAERTMQYMDDSSQAASAAAAAAQRERDSHKSASWWPSWAGGGAASPPPPPASFATRIYQSINLDRTDDTAYYESDPYYRYDYRYAYSEPAAYFTLIKAAIKYVGSGRALRHLTRGTDEPVYVASVNDEGSIPTDADVLQLDTLAVNQDDSDDDDSRGLGWWGTLTDNWKYGKGGIWEGQRPSGKQSEDASPVTHEASNSPETSSSTLPLPAKEDLAGNKEETQRSKATYAERYDARTARPLSKDERPVRPVTRKKRVVVPPQQAAHQARGTWLERVFLQLSLGASLVGMSSFLTILLGMSTWAPFHLNLGLGRGFARLARRRTRGGGSGGGGGGGEGEALVAVFLLFLVIVGIIRALFAVYALTNYISKRLLTRVEDIILDWGADDQEQQEQLQHDDVAARDEAAAEHIQLNAVQDPLRPPPPQQQQLRQRQWLATAHAWPQTQWQTLRLRLRRRREDAPAGAGAN